MGGLNKVNEPQVGMVEVILTTVWYCICCNGKTREMTRHNSLTQMMALRHQRAS